MLVLYLIEDVFLFVMWGGIGFSSNCLKFLSIAIFHCQHRCGRACRRRKQLARHV